MMIPVEKILPAARERLAVIRHDAPTKAAAKLLNNHHINLVVICDDLGHMVGVITKTDLVRQMGDCGGHGCKISAVKIMSRKVTYCQPSDSLHYVWLKMKKEGFFHIPVVDKDLVPLGIINARDALLTLLESSEHEGEFLRDYVIGNGYR